MTPESPMVPLRRPTFGDGEIHALRAAAGRAHEGGEENPYNPQAWITGKPDIGEGTWIGPFTVIDGSGGLRIGRGCDIASGAQIYTHSTVRRCVSARAYATVDRAPVTIGDHVFIGPLALVMMGVTIGDRAVIVGGAVVLDDVPPLTVVGGVPAKPIGRVEVREGEVRFFFPGSDGGRPDSE